ncbi:MAG: tetratricopeptide repeat protein [Planctomycetota bacterium]
MPTIEQLERALAADPEDAFILYGLAQEHAKAGHTDDALAFFDRCLQSDPSYCYAYYHKAKALEAAGRADEAITVLQAGADAASEHRDAKAQSEIAEYLASLGA